MRPGLNESVSVLSTYSKDKKIFKPQILTWGGIDYRLGEVDFYHKTKKGLKVLHHFSVTDRDQTTYFKLTFDASSLNWTLDEYMMADSALVNY